MPPELRGRDHSLDPQDRLGRREDLDSTALVLHASLARDDFQTVFPAPRRPTDWTSLRQDSIQWLSPEQVQAHLTKFRAELPELAKEHRLDSTQVGQFMDVFERRYRACRSGDANLNHCLQTDRQMLETYCNLRDILIGQRTDPRALRRDSAKVFLSALYNIARPEHIVQGRRECGENIQQKFAVNNPHHYTDLLAQVSCNWVYRKGDVTVVLPDNARRITQAEYNWDPRNGGSNLCNLANIIYSRVSIGIVRPGYDGYSCVGMGGRRSVFDGLVREDIERMSQVITGRTMPLIEMGRGDLRHYSPEKLQYMKRHGEWPVGLLTAPSSHNPSRHAVTITDIREKPDGQGWVVYVEDNYGARRHPGWRDYNQLVQADIAARPWYNAMAARYRHPQPQQLPYDPSYLHPQMFQPDYRNGRVSRIPLQLQQVLSMLQQQGFPRNFPHDFGSPNGQRSQVIRQYLRSILQQQLQQRGTSSPYNQYVPYSYPYDQPNPYPQSYRDYPEDQYYRPYTPQPIPRSQPFCPEPG